jgi:putative transcriptional regulator
MPTETVPSDLTAKLLIAMPGMGDPRFAGSVVFLCSHSDKGAMGLIVNKRMDEVTFSELLEQLEIARPDTVRDVPVCYGGPVELRRGFVLHSSDYAARGDEGLEIDDRFAMTATLDVLEDIANGRGPRQALLALGYAGWGAGQLEDEIARQWLAHRRGRAGPRVRCGDGRQMGGRASVNRRPSSDAVVGGRARLRRSGQVSMRVSAGR